MVTKKPGGAALYLQIAEEIKRDLFKLRYGEQIPSESELMEQYNVSRGTVRQAVSMLVNRGYLYKMLGKGTYRGNGAPVYDVHNSIPTFTRNVILSGNVPSISGISLQTCVADEEIADHLSVPMGEEIWRLSRYRGIQNQETECYAVAYILKDAIPDLKEDDLELSIIEMITKKFGIHISSTTNSISAMVADSKLAEELGIDCGKVILATDFVARDNNKRPFLYDKSYNWGSTYHYVIESEYIPK